MTQSWAIAPDIGAHGVLRDGKWLPLRAMVWIVALVFVVMLIFGPTIEALAHLFPQQPRPQFAVQAIGAGLILVVYSGLVRLGEKRAPSELSLRAAPSHVLLGMVVGLSMFSVLMAVLTGAGLYRFDYHGFAPAWHGAGLAIQSAVLEEVLVRGVILRVMWRAFGPWLAFILSAFLFGAGHIGNPGATWFTTLCISLEAGIMLGAFYALTGRLWVSIGVHAGWNFTQGYLFGAAVSGGDFGRSIATSTARSGHPDWLTGGEFGPEASLPSLVICVAVGGVALCLAFRRGSLSLRSPAATAADLRQSPVSNGKETPSDISVEVRL